MVNRKYRSSLDAAFSANVAFILYECEAAPNTRIVALHQESHEFGYLTLNKLLIRFTVRRRKYFKNVLTGENGEDGTLLGGTLRLGGIQGEVRMCHHLPLPKDVQQQ